AALVGRASGIEADAEPAETAGAMGHAEAPAEPHETEPAGLALEQDGYRLTVEREALTPGRAEEFVFRILDAEGADAREFELEHERLLHLVIVARPPHAHFLHLHPRQRADGAWTVPVRLPANGSYRVFADFTTGGERRTLGIDLVGSGGPETAPEEVTAHDVALDARGERLAFGVRAEGRPVELQPYLGALGHLVVIREGDFGYVHAHAEEDELAFDVPFPTPGRYRLYLQYQADGRVETVRFTRTVA
ncbi:MAG TPA: hypothetical protein VNT23_04720, partial [Gaiellaceae bacterium]|nr:hypothetical protein [Gaiellaceae bacterium]